MAKKTSAQCTIEELQNALSQVEADRLTALDGLRQIQIISQTLFQGEATRLSQKLGEDHPRVRELEMQIERNPSLVNDLEVAQEVARIRVPEVEESGALIHGRVTDENRRGVAGLTVYAEDEAGETIDSLDAAETDLSGYYALQVDPDTVAQLSDVGGLYLVVAAEDGEVVHRESEPLTLAAGDRIVVDITLKRGDMTVVRTERRSAEREPSSTKEDDEGPGFWIGQGQVTDENGQGVGGLLVRLFDKDRRYDDKLGAALTDKNGNFTISYRVQDFREGDEPGPDLYLLVTDQEGNDQFTSAGAVRFDAGRVETFQITITSRGSDPQADTDPGDV